jgi:hypothetical protein
MGNTELRPLINCPDYFASFQGDIYRKTKGRPRNKDVGSIWLSQNGEYYRMLKGNRRGKYRNYLAVDIDGDQSLSIHRLVLSAFNPVENWEELQVNHKDRNGFNNSLNNLEWCDNQYNCQHRFLTDSVDIERAWSDYLDYLDHRIQTSFEYIPMAMGSWRQIYDKEKICSLLKTTDLTKQEIAEKANCSHRAVRYYQEIFKFERPYERIKRELTPYIVRRVVHEGASLYDVSRETALSYSAVRNIAVKCNDYPLRSRGQVSSKRRDS